MVVNFLTAVTSIYCLYCRLVIAGHPISQRTKNVAAIFESYTFMLLWQPTYCVSVMKILLTNTEGDT
jgi:ribonuclease I